MQLFNNFNNIEEKVIFEKLTKNENIETHRDITEYNSDFNEPFNPDKIFKYVSEITGYIDVLESKRQNYAYRTLIPYRKYIGNIIVFFKKIIRRLIKFYIEPIAFQQTDFNSAVTPSIGRLTEIQVELLKGINSLKNENSRLKEELGNKQNEIEKNFNELNDYNNKLENKYKALEESLNLKINELSKIQEIESLNLKINELSKIQEITNAQTMYNEQKLAKLDALELDIFEDKLVSFWDKKTYSQSGEDGICAYIGMTLGKSLEECTYIDLGANHAKDLSNTYLFYSHGARGVLVEANPSLIPELKFYRNEDIILNKCVSAKSGEYVDFYILSGDGLSTPSLESANEFISKNPTLKIVDTVKVETINVNDIIGKYLGKAPVIMNIDIEGKDMDILKSVNFDKYRPLMIIAEMIEYKPTLTVQSKNNKILNFMEEHSYAEYAFTGINSIFIDKTQMEEVL